MKFSVELVVDIDDSVLTNYHGADLFITFQNNGVVYSQSGDKINVQGFHFAGQKDKQWANKVLNIMPMAGKAEEPI